jgi:general secretion pathway protein J
MKRNGFTLLELVVATIIFTVVVAAAYALFESSRGVSSRAEARATLFQAARAALRAVEDDVRGAVQSGSVFDTGLIGTNAGSADAPADRLELVSVNSQPFRTGTDVPEPRIDLSRVTYSIDESTATAATGLVRERHATLTALEQPAGRDEDVEEISVDVTGVNFRYYDTEWKDEWDSTSLGKLPKAVEVTVTVKGEWRGKAITEKFMSRFYLPVGAETPAKTQ